MQMLHTSLSPRHLAFVIVFFLLGIAVVIIGFRNYSYSGSVLSRKIVCNSKVMQVNKTLCRSMGCDVVSVGYVGFTSGTGWACTYNLSPAL